MRLATTVSFPGRFDAAIADTLEAPAMERAGLDRVWVGETAGPDSASLLGYLAATTGRLELGAGVFNPFTRTPALLAMTATALDALSGGRFLFGIGTANPRVIEGLHGLSHKGATARLGE